MQFAYPTKEVVHLGLVRRARAVICPVCGGKGKYKGKICHGCNGRGWVTIYDEEVVDTRGFEPARWTRNEGGWYL